MDEQLDLARRWAEKFRRFRLLTWMGLVVLALGQAFLVKAFDIQARFQMPRSWSWPEIRTAATSTMSSTWHANVGDLWLAIPGFIAVGVGVAMLIPAFVSLVGWWTRAQFAAAAVGRRSWCPWPLALASWCIPLVQLVAPAMITTHLVPKRDPSRRTIWKWWVLTLLVVFPLFTGGGAFPGLGRVAWQLVFLLGYGVLVHAALRATAGVMTQIDSVHRSLRDATITG